LIIKALPRNLKSVRNLSEIAFFESIDYIVYTPGYKNFKYLYKYQ